MGKARWKVVSAKKLSARKRGLGRFAVLPCMFSDNVLCSQRKSAKNYITDICSKCSHYLRFEHEMDAEDERVMDEIDKEMGKHSTS